MDFIQFSYLYEKWILIILGFFLFTEKYYLVYSGYPNRKGYLAPYKGQRYHILEFQSGSQPIGLKEIFNHVHSSLRNVIEHSFGVLKMKWCILLDVPGYPIEEQKKFLHGSA
jgi:hypothetical protein